MRNPLFSVRSLGIYGKLNYKANKKVSNVRSFSCGFCTEFTPKIAKPFCPAKDI